MTTKFENNDIVRIVPKASPTCPPTIKVYDKNGNACRLIVDPDFEYIVDETSVMPIRQLNNGTITLYPLSAGRNAHTKKFYVSEEYLEFAYPDEEEQDDEDNEDNDSNELYDTLMELSKSLLKVSNVLAVVAIEI